VKNQVFLLISLLDYLRPPEITKCRISKELSININIDINVDINSDTDRI